jgi:hypothetical protein
MREQRPQSFDAKPPTVTEGDEVALFPSTTPLHTHRIHADNSNPATFAHASHADFPPLSIRNSILLDFLIGLSRAYLYVHHGAAKTTTTVKHREKRKFSNFVHAVQAPENKMPSALLVPSAQLPGATVP